MRILITLFIWSMFFPSQAQNSRQFIEIRGKIVEHKSESPMAFATIGVKGSPHGTVSNPDGEFALFLPAVCLNDTLSISHVGFKNYEIPIKEIANSHLTVTLIERITVLEEVQVNGERLTGTQIMQKALDHIADNFSSDPFMLKGIFRDIREQNDETVYLVEAAVEVKDQGYFKAGDRPKKFFLRGVRASDSRVNGLLRHSLLNAGNSLKVNLEHNFWLNRLKHSIRNSDYTIEEVITKNDRVLYSIITNKPSAKSPLADKYADMTFTLTHRYLVDAETYAIYKVEHMEQAIDGKYVGIEPPYAGDTLFYSKKGWNQVIDFEAYQNKMYLKYHHVNYAFDIVDEKNKEVFLDMGYQFTFIVTDIETNGTVMPEGNKMNRNRPLTLQSNGYDQEFWEDPSNAKLVPLTKKQIHDLELERPLEEQFRSKKKRPKNKINVN